MAAAATATDSSRIRPGHRASRSKLSSSSSPKKELRSRSRSRSRLFGKDKTDTLNREAAPAQSYADTRTPEQIDSDFVDLLDELQVQPDLRQKLLGLNPTVKASMLQGQATLSLAAFGLDTLSSSPAKSTRMPIPDLLKNRPASRPGSVLLPSSPRPDQPSTLNHSGDSDELMAAPNTAQLFGSGPPRQASSGSANSGSSGSGHTKQPSNGSRIGIRDAFKKSNPNLGQGGSFISLAASTAGGTSSVTSTARPRSMSFGKEFAASFGKETPESFATMLKCTDASRIDVARVKRMRAVLAAESPIWISTFIGAECGGYDAMLARLDELLAMEWREEQHDDMLLHELLRCFVALSTTEVGRNALASQAPRPFRQLADLLFSEKKPGDLGTRKLMIELLSILLDLQLPASHSHSHSSLNYLIELLQNPSDPAKDSVVDFIKQTHAPRPFKAYVVEISCVCRDYFWIFCHSQNFYWRFDELSDKIDSIKGPKVPGGMTGGVEFEAMAYLTVHLRLINAVANVLGQIKSHQLPRPAMTAAEFHSSMFASGLERVLVTLRKASQHYYPTTHLELARYLSLAQQAGFALPYHLTDWLESPKLKPAPLLPPLELPHLHAPSTSQALAPSAIPTGGAPAGYGLAGAFITPSTPARGSSAVPTSPIANTPRSAIRSPPAAPRTASRSPDKSSRKPDTDSWDFTTSDDTARRVETVPFDRLNSQFSLTEEDPAVGMPSSSTSRRIFGLTEAITQDLTPARFVQKAGGNVVGSAVQMWESRSVAQRSPQKGQR
uniref:Formin GTPase-binding domain-containing protein n=1 Tax=Kalmanozyma brasiliensis (strain GHG001) TaxID=1365824 RepID=V5EWX3_KALBG